MQKMPNTIINIAQPNIGKAEEKAVLKVLHSGVLAQGERVKQFENNFAQFVGSKYAVATSNGTTALHIALLGLDIGKGDEVITTPFTFIASSNSILYTNAKPVFVDIDPTTFNIDPNLIEKKITSKTRAIMPVHLYGLPANMNKINVLAKKYNLFVIEDACQAHGASIKKPKAGILGDVGCFSFYPTKNMTTGEGGMITTNNKKLADRMRLLREHGMHIRYHHDIVGYNFRMTNIAAAIGIEQLKKLEDFNTKRLKNALFYTEKLQEVKGIITPFIPENYHHAFHQYTIRINKDYPLTRDKLAELLLKNHIRTGIYYPIPVHQQKAYKDIGFKGQFPVAEQLSHEVLSLPVHPQLTKKDLIRVVASITNAS
jgi:perosamine synthetase